MASQAAASRASDAASRGKTQPQIAPFPTRPREARTNVPSARFCSFSPHFFNKKTRQSPCFVLSF